MIEKVKVTRKQAVAIDIYNDKELSRMAVADIYLNSNFYVHKSLNSLTFDELMTALYIGYEVEPEYERGQYVTHESGYVGVIKNVSCDFVEVDHNYAFVRHWGKSSTRHSTEVEITQEKEQRADKKLDKLLLDLNSEERIRLYRKLDCRLDIEVE